MGPVWPATCEDVAVVEVDRPNRQLRRSQGKSDVVDAVEAGRAVMSGRARGIAKHADGNAEALRVALVAKRSARDRSHRLSQPDSPSRLLRTR